VVLNEGQINILKYEVILSNPKTIMKEEQSF